MLPVCAQKLAYPVSLRATGRRVGAVPAVNPSPETNNKRQETYPRQVRQSRGRRANDQALRDHAPAPVQAFSTSGEVLVSLQNLGEQERHRSQPCSYEAAARYEDRYYGLAHAGQISGKFA